MKYTNKKIKIKIT